MHYYSEDGTIFMSKVRALEYGRKKQQKINFYYYDDVYSKCDWTTEPSESLEYYYKEQAQRIRDNYDYLILCYSGGADSTNILETFHFNGIKLDKIITVGALSKDPEYGSDKNHNGELYHNVFPYIKELGLESITEVIDYTKFFDDINSLSIVQYQDEWIDIVGPWYSPHHWFWRDLEKHVVPKNIGNKRVAIIFGKDKPGLFYGKTNKPDVILPSGNTMLNGFNFKDTPCSDYGNLNLPYGYTNIDRVNFYWDPTYPQILLKQLHVLKNHYVITHSTSYDPFLGSQMFGGKMTDHIVYNLKRPLVFKSPKSITPIISLRDDFLKDSKDSDVFKLHDAGIKKMKMHIDLNELVTINSKFYNILKG